MLVADKENFRFRLSESLKSRWMSMCNARGITQQKAIERIVEWFLACDVHSQSMILGRNDVTPESLANALEAARKAQDSRANKA